MAYEIIVCVGRNERNITNDGFCNTGGSSLTITDEMLCAGVVGTVRSGCHGDSGGPLSCQNNQGRYVLQGVVSWGSPKCDTRERYSVFARVAKFRKWIDLVMRS